MNPTSLERAINGAAVVRHDPAGREYRSLLSGATQTLAGQFGLTLRGVEIEALERGIVPERYQRTIGAIGLEGQLRLRRSRIGIAGAGGLGGAVFEILVRAGAGAVTIVDCDDFEESNLNRQLLAADEEMGRSKVRAAALRARKINPGVEVAACKERIDAANGSALFDGVHVLVDALGTVADRFLVQRAARALGIPLVHAAVSGHRGQLMSVCPGDGGLEYIYGSESSAPRSGTEAQRGTPPATVTAVAALQAQEVIAIVCNRRPAHRNRLTLVDMTGPSLRSMTLRPSSAL